MPPYSFSSPDSIFPAPAYFQLAPNEAHHPLARVRSEARVGRMRLLGDVLNQHGDIGHLLLAYEYSNIVWKMVNSAKLLHHNRFYLGL